MGLVRYNPAFVCISGKLGDLVFYTRNGTHCVRSHVVPRDPKTDRQVERRKRFAALVARWRAMEKAEKQAWNERARGSARTGFNEFLSVEMKKGEGARSAVASPMRSASPRGPSLSSRATAGSAAILLISGTMPHGDHHVGPWSPHDDTSIMSSTANSPAPREAMPLSGNSFLLRHCMPAPCGGLLLFGGSPKSSAKRLPLKRRGALVSAVGKVCVCAVRVGLLPVLPRSPRARPRGSLACAPQYYTCLHRPPSTSCLGTFTFPFSALSASPRETMLLQCENLALCFHMPTPCVGTSQGGGTRPPPCTHPRAAQTPRGLCFLCDGNLPCKGRWKTSVSAPAPLDVLSRVFYFPFERDNAIAFTTHSSLTSLRASVPLWFAVIFSLRAPRLRVRECHKKKGRLRRPFGGSCIFQF